MGNKCNQLVSCTLFKINFHNITINYFLLIDDERISGDRSSTSFHILCDPKYSKNLYEFFVIEKQFILNSVIFNYSEENLEC